MTCPFYIFGSPSVDDHFANQVAGVMAIVLVVAFSFHILYLFSFFGVQNVGNKNLTY